MGTVYQRLDSRFWWVSWFDADGRRRFCSTGSEDRGVAVKLLKKLEARVAVEKATGVSTGPLTLERFAQKVWLPARRARGVVSVDKDEDCLAHALPTLGHMLLDEVRRDDVKALMATIMRGELAPRTQRAIYATLRVLFADALADNLVTATPCTLTVRKRELPRKQDKSVGWRRGAVFTRPEVEALISDPRIPHWRRVLWAMLFLTGTRVGEIAPRRWSDYDQAAEPLGCLFIGSHWDSKAKVERQATKTGVAREVPVHPTLASVLAAWRMGGWEAYQGRAPGLGDLIVPTPYHRAPDSPAGAFLNPNASLRRLKADCELLGIRERDQHSMRRTFISLGIADKADETILKVITHEGRDSAFDDYKVLPWATLCGEVRKLKISLRSGAVVRLAAGVTPVLRQFQGGEMPEEKSGRGGTRRLLPSLRNDSVGGDSLVDSGSYRSQDERTALQDAAERNNVTPGDDEGGSK